MVGAPGEPRTGRVGCKGAGTRVLGLVTRPGSFDAGTSSMLVDNSRHQSAAACEHTFRRRKHPTGMDPCRGRRTDAWPAHQL